MSDQLEQAANHGYNPSRSYTVASDAFVRVEFGYIELTNFPSMNAVLVEFHGGSEYIYLGVSDDLYNALEALCVAHSESGGSVRVGSTFSRSLFNGYRGYARLNR